jgi:maltose phosphorylase
MLVKNNILSFTTQIPSEWKAYSFKVNFRGQIVKVNVTNLQTTFELEGGEALDIIVNDSPLTISPKNLVVI